MEYIYKKDFPKYLMIYINLLHYVYILFLNKWLILHAHCKLLVDLWDYNQVFEKREMSCPCFSHDSWMHMALNIKLLSFK